MTPDIAAIRERSALWVKNGCPQPEHQYDMAPNDRAALLAHIDSGWIPTRERNPEKHGAYIVSVQHAKWTDLVEVREDVWNGKEWRDGSEIGWVVLAWRPLPEPYRPGGEG